MSLFRSTIFSSRSTAVGACLRQIRHESSAKEIADQQHSGSRSAPRPTEETGTSTQAPHDRPGSSPPKQNELSESHQQRGPEQEDGEPGSSSPMAHTEDKQGGELKSNSPFRAAPEEKKVG
ncbi:protein of unknown function [Taphrina deformans PYCC 5710]|uniref:Uncharacterized protein n=1 Tax=Taphrina deformans (strain PYCC 5710 / ATCC 11124 / CBS 356.35 / IMI 108563 / JCM 9778 / NBRC 8474) TaxID=1097556 RepID=R4XA45_TAPDE|nr:protein of unknown function [Taphrina deformans PYCC 5710]|eukprot:CCG81144.1 protein of unknown function [Taphrina deformans PYCC 5710]